MTALSTMVIRSLAAMLQAPHDLVLRGFFIFRPALHRFVAGYGYFSISNVKDLDLVQNAVTRLFSIASPAYPGRCSDVDT